MKEKWQNNIFQKIALPIMYSLSPTMQMLMSLASLVLPIQVNLFWLFPKTIGTQPYKLKILLLIQDLKQILFWKGIN